ncbi:triose-phosphate isomerase [Propionispora vibrioides]|uniref:Triosephosphate isomerase n=1 Tax=Propionispora vibrioides TaxID=112903 RepID=A0A1H8T4W5_9FIRM|nr:triose-phosphate isomerase [Propionispora vibrioides]SEO85922.1 triosephosphate isomerase [Propionispora vibrioides]
MKRKIKTPFFSVNPKGYLYGKEVVELAVEADRLAKQYNIDLFYTAQVIDFPAINEVAERIFLTAQHMDPLAPGRGMGYIFPAALQYYNVKATFLNHAEHPMNLRDLVKTIKLANSLEMYTIACADSVEEAQAIAQLKPDILICEPTELIGTGQTSSAHYRETSNTAVKQISPDTLVLQGAGISTGKDVYQVIKAGADGTGGTSGIVCAPDKVATLREMIEALVDARSELGM